MPALKRVGIYRDRRKDRRDAQYLLVGAIAIAGAKCPLLINHVLILHACRAAIRMAPWNTLWMKQYFDLARLLIFKSLRALLKTELVCNELFDADPAFRNQLNDAGPGVQPVAE